MGGIVIGDSSIFLLELFYLIKSVFLLKIEKDKIKYEEGYVGFWYTS